VDGVGGPVVLAGLPDDRVVVVLAAVVDGHSDSEGEGGLALGDVPVADRVGAVGGDAEGGVESVEGLLAGPLGWPVVVVVDPIVRVDSWASAASWWWARVGWLPIQELLPAGGRGGRGLCLAAARAHPLDTFSRPGGQP
jgi:hypothetical protein